MIQPSPELATRLPSGLLRRRARGSSRGHRCSRRRARRRCRGARGEHRPRQHRSRRSGADFGGGPGRTLRLPPPACRCRVVSGQASGCPGFCVGGVARLTAVAAPPGLEEQPAAALRGDGVVPPLEHRRSGCVMLSAVLARTASSRSLFTRSASSMRMLCFRRITSSSETSSWYRSAGARAGCASRGVAARCKTDTSAYRESRAGWRTRAHCFRCARSRPWGSAPAAATRTAGSLTIHRSSGVRRSRAVAT